MAVIAALSFGEAITIVIALMGIAGVVFTALRFNRDDTTAIVNQQSSIVADMKVLNDELRSTVDRLRVENEELRRTVDRLTRKLPDA